jgi:hypothetical protein
MASRILALDMVLPSLVCGGTTLDRSDKRHFTPFPWYPRRVLAMPFSLRPRYRFSRAEKGIWHLRSSRYRHLSCFHHCQLEVEARSGVCYRYLVVFGLLTPTLPIATIS